MGSSPDNKSQLSSLLWVGTALGALSSLTVIGLLYLGDQLFTYPFVPFDIFDWMARTLPGGLIAFVTRSMVVIIAFLQGFLPIGTTSTVAKLAEQTIAILQLIGGGAIFGFLLAWLGRDRRKNLILYGQIGGLILLAATLAIESALPTTQLGAGDSLWLTLIFVAWGWILAWLIHKSTPTVAEEPGTNLSRRQFLTVSGAGLSAVALGAWGIGRLFGSDKLPQASSEVARTLNDDDPYSVSLTSGPAASPSSEELAARLSPVRGTRAELTSTEDFYRIDINTRPPTIDGESWQLSISGMVDTPKQFSIDEIRAFPSQTQILTMQCISNTIGGDLTSSTRWTGVRFKDVLDSLGIQAGVAGALIKSVDGFFEFVVIDDILDERTLLVYEMNGEALPSEHGFPLRVYIPNRYGMKQPKWIESIELLDERVDGYWVERGWSREANAKTVSVVDTIVVDLDLGDQGMAMGGGIAWAGERGISKVEVQLNDGPWEEAELIAPPLSSLNWMLWRYAWPYEEGRHNLSVRAYDGAGHIQESERSPARPDGATDIHSITANL